MSEEVAKVVVQRSLKRTSKPTPSPTPSASPQQPLPFTGKSPSVRGKGSSEQSLGITPVSSMFLVCLGLGATLALLGLSHNPLLRVAGVLGPIGATVAYPLWGISRRLHTRAALREKFADNCYYLGFIFTQVSLVCGFMPVALLNREITSQDVLRFFGVALGSSLIGLVFRTVIVQTAHSVAENADIVEQEVDLLARRVSQQSQDVLEQFGVLAEQIGRTHERVSRELEERVGSVGSTLKGFEAALQRDVVVFGEGADAVGRASHAAAGDLTAQRVGLVEAMQSTVTAIEALRTSLSIEVSAASLAIRQTAEALQLGMVAFRTASELEPAVSVLEERLTVVGSKIDGLDGALANANDRAALASERLAGAIEQRVDEAKAETAKTVEAFSSELAQSVAALEATLSGFRSEMERLRV